MTVTDVQQDPTTLTLTIRSEYTSPIDRVWQMWADPRKLERWWGPPTFPATVTEHNLTTGGRVVYFMTSPEGDRHFGWSEFKAVDAPTSLRFEDGFGDETGAPIPDMPVSSIAVDLADSDSDSGSESDSGSGTTMTIATTFPSAEAMDQMISMGMAEGMALALGQIDDLLAADNA